MIQYTSTYEREIEKQVKDINVQYVLYSEFMCRVNDLKKYLFCKKYPDLKSFIYESLWADRTKTIMHMGEVYLLNNDFDNMDTINMRISPPKVGNVSLGKSMGGTLFSQMHTYSFIPNCLKKFLQERKVNVIMGVRDIIGQHISLLFQNVEEIYWDLDTNWINGGDVQKIFEQFFVNEDEETDCWYNYLSQKQNTKGGRLPYFFDVQLKPFWGIDIYEYPFDKEKGYSIYHFDNLNIMIYQLEKIGSLEEEIGEFLQIKDFKLVKANDSENKWYLDTYKKAQKELRFDKRYYERCYTGKFMNHFYSDNDIERFKEKWEKNLK